MVVLCGSVIFGQSSYRQERLETHLARFDITLAGDLNLDFILHGVPEELPRERDMLASGMQLTLGGSSAIVAHNLAALGCRVGFQARLAHDEFGELLLKRLREIGVDVSRICTRPGDSTGVTVILHRETWRNTVSFCGTITELTIDDLDFSYLTDARHFHLSSFYLQQKLRPSVPGLFRKLKAAGVTISLDTNDDPDDAWEGGLQDALKHVDVFMPNAREACKAAGTEDKEEANRRLAQMVPVLVVKSGAEGSIAYSGGKRIVSPPIRVECVDAVGAGDSFDAGFLSEFVRGSSLEKCLAKGNLAGALSVTRGGGTEAFRDREYREDFLEKHSLRESG